MLTNPTWMCVDASRYEKFTRIVIDTAPTGHTLRLLTLPSFIALSIDKILRFRSVITQLAGQSKGDVAIEKLEELQRQMSDAQVLFRDKERTEFVIVGIPTYVNSTPLNPLSPSLSLSLTHTHYTSTYPLSGGSLILCCW